MNNNRCILCGQLFIGASTYIDGEWVRADDYLRLQRVYEAQTEEIKRLRAEKPADEYRVWKCGRCQNGTPVEVLDCTTCGWRRGAQCTCGTGNIARRAHTKDCAVTHAQMWLADE